MATGVVKWFNGQKGFGFIQPDDVGKTCSCTYSAVERANLASLHEGQKIQLRAGKGPRTARRPLPAAKRLRTEAGSLESRRKTNEAGAARPPALSFGGGRSHET